MTEVKNRQLWNFIPGYKKVHEDCIIEKRQCSCENPEISAMTKFFAGHANYEQYRLAMRILQEQKTSCISCRW